jgi:hypothetical protein
MADALPGSPNPAQLAAADQRHAAVRTAVDRLVAEAHGLGPTTAEWIRFTHDNAVDAAMDFGGEDDEDFQAAALGILAEAVLRLAGRSA